MSKEKRRGLKTELILAMAAGNPVAEWARANGVAERTAQRWASEHEVRAEVDAIRRSVIDEAVGRLSQRAGWAADAIGTLAEHAKSESVRLTALRSILSDVISVTHFAGLERRIAKLEEQDHVQSAGSRSAGCAG